MANLIEVFKDTRNVSKVKYGDWTKQLIRNTRVYNSTKSLVKDAPYSMTSVKFTSGGTAGTAYSYRNSNRRVAMLNFANPTTPGGGVEGGSTAQEENLCRCTNLYESLTSKIALNRYYKANMDDIKGWGADNARLIYSPDVVIFKNDVTYSMIAGRVVDVISCAAPMSGDTKTNEKLIKNKMRCIFNCAVARDVDVLVLGAWGCGVFGQNPEYIAKFFAEVLTEYAGYFAMVDFAIRGSDTKADPIFSVFKSAFMEAWDGKKGRR